MDYTQYASLFMPHTSSPAVPTDPGVADRMLASTKGNQANAGQAQAQAGRALGEYIKKAQEEAAKKAAQDAEAHRWTDAETKAFGAPENAPTGNASWMQEPQPADSNMPSWLQDNQAQTVASGDGLAGDAAISDTWAASEAAQEGAAMYDAMGQMMTYGGLA